MGIRAGSEADVLIDILDSESPAVRRNAAWALGQIISLDNDKSSKSPKKLITEAKKACRQLIEMLQDPDSSVRSEAAGALALLANQAERNNSFEMTEVLEKARDAIGSGGAGGNLDANSQLARKTIDKDLEILKGRSFRQNVLLLANNRWIVVFSLSVLSFLLWFVILRFVVLLRRPLLILHWNQILQSSQALKIPGTEITIPLRHGLLLGYYNFHDRVLDAWVDSQCPTAREIFKSSDPCKEKSVWISLPVALQDEIVTELRPSQLLPVLNRKSWHIRILGEGGS